MLGTTVGARKHRHFPVECDRVDSAFDNVVVHFGTATTDEAVSDLPSVRVHSGWVGNLRPFG